MSLFAGLFQHSKAPASSLFATPSSPPVNELASTKSKKSVAISDGNALQPSVGGDGRPAKKKKRARAEAEPQPVMEAEDPAVDRKQKKRPHASATGAAPAPKKPATLPADVAAADGPATKKAKSSRPHAAEERIAKRAARRAAPAEAKPDQPGQAAVDAADSPQEPAQTEAQRRAAEAQLKAEQEKEKLARTVFVGNLPIDMDKSELKKLFKRYGKVESARIRSVPLKPESVKLSRRAAVMSGKVNTEEGSSTHGYVVFADAAAMPAALQANMSEVDGLHIRVDRAAPTNAGGKAGKGAGAKQAAVGGAAVRYDPFRSVFVGNLPFDVKDEPVIRFFSDPAHDPVLENAVEAVRVVRDSVTHRGRGVAYVMFVGRPAAVAALALNGKDFGGRPIRVTRVSAARSGTVATAQQQRQQQRGGKPLRGVGAAADGAPAGAGKKAVADWQGTMTKGKNKKLRGIAKAAAPSGGKARSGAGAGAPGNRKRSDKRPSVAARKAKAKGVPGGGVVKKSFKARVREQAAKARKSA